MRVKEYPKQETFGQNDVLLIDGDNGVKSMYAKDIVNALSKFTSKEQYYNLLDKFITLEDRKNTFRGKNLGGGSPMHNGMKSRMELSVAYS